MTEQFRPVTSAEFIAVVSERLDLLDWIAACAFMRAAYGPQAYKIVAEIEEQGYYDDENYYDIFSRLDVFDQDGNTLKPDLSQKYWKEIIALSSTYRGRWGEVYTEEKAAHNRLFDHEDPPIPLKNTTYIIDQPPCEIAGLYVPIKEAS